MEYEKKKIRLGDSNLDDELSFIRDSREDAKKEEKEKKENQLKTSKKEKDSKTKGLKEGFTRKTFVIKEEFLEKIEMFAYWERLTVTEVVNLILEEFFRNKKIKSIPEKKLL